MQHGPTFFIYSLEYLPLGSLSFLRKSQTLSPTLKWTSLLLLPAFSLYFKLDFCTISLTFYCNFVISSSNSWHWALILKLEGSSIRSNGPLGCRPYTVWNGVLPIDLFKESLKENFSWGRIVSQLWEYFLVRHLRRLPKDLFTTSIYPSIYGW